LTAEMVEELVQTCLSETEKPSLTPGQRLMC
jgi:hypothetical protein